MEDIREKIYRAGLKFLSPLTLQETYKQVVKEAMKLVKADSGSILIDQKGELKRVYASSPDQYKVKPRKRGYMRQVYLSKIPLILTPDQISKVNPDILKLTSKSIVVIPIYYKQKSLGVITLHSLQENHFTQEDINTLKLFSPMATLAIRKAQLNDENTQALKARDLFISMAAHEFRTPLTTIHGYAQLLYSKLAKTDTAVSRWAEELTWESYRLSLLVNELLEIDRIKTGEFRYVFKECSLKEIINRAIMDFRFTHPEYSLALRNKLTDSQDKIVGDYNKLLQAIINLLDNAAKFSSSQEVITITLKHNPGFIILEIKDKGKGIPNKDFHKVYEMFYKGDNTSKEGMGLGLFLAKNIINQHRGTISLKSKENKGTTVQIKLPLHKQKG